MLYHSYDQHPFDKYSIKLVGASFLLHLLVIFGAAICLAFVVMKSSFALFSPPPYPPVLYSVMTFGFQLLAHNLSQGVEMYLSN